MTDDTAPRIRCRLITEEDAPEITGLLVRGFPSRPEEYWSRALERLAQREAPPGYPRFGYMLESAGSAVGVILMIFSEGRVGGAAKARCNISSWYVDPRCQGYASLLIAAAVRLKDVTYMNLSPAIHTWPVIEAQGFRRYCSGQVVSVPALGPWASGAGVQDFSSDEDYGPSLTSAERDILETHRDYGCLSLVVREEGETHPFVFLERRLFSGILPALQLIYCRELKDYVRFSGALGRRLWRRGYLAAIVDSEGMLPGTVGLYRPERGPKYFKGPERPRIGDLSFCEAVVFGP
jgi:hypothetical protein